MTTRKVLLVQLVAAAAFLATLAIFWPGYVAYDSLTQYRQALSGAYDDWHPPVMAHLWALFGARGPGPMLALQLAGYWAGFGLLAGALVRFGRPGATLVLFGLAIWPPLLGWQTVVLKDTQMAAAMLAAAGLTVWPMRHRAPKVAIIGLLLGYAALVRANAVFAVVPFAVMLLRPIGAPAFWRQAGVLLIVTLAAILAAIGVSSAINHAVLGAARSGVERTQPTYDLAGVAVRSGDAAIGLPHDAIARLRAGKCVRPYFWDPLGEAMRCADDVRPLARLSPGALYVTLAGAALRHPLAYAAHRLAHLNSTWRWLVPFRWPGAAPPMGNEPNTYGFVEPGRAAWFWQRLAGWLVELPLCWPILWVAVALARLPAVWGGTSPIERTAAALLVSALGLELSFGVLSIASDLRYHLWPMAATAIACILVGGRRLPRPGWVVIALILVTGIAARLMLPLPPQTYAGMLG